jgi:two-component system, chemotaxis family, chemotaxis protein CheY
VRALVVDDSAVTRRLVGRIVAGLGFEVVEAADGEEALACLRRYDDVGLALVDWNMAPMDGIAFVRAVRAEPGHRDLRLMMITAQTGPEAIALALEEGADEYLMKPFTADHLADKLELLGVAP